MSWFSLLPIALKFIGWVLGKSADKKKAEREFIELVSALEYGGMKSVGLNDSYREQIEARKKQREKAEAQGGD